MKKALIIGVTGQDGSYLAEILLSKGYLIYALTRKASWEKPHSATHLKNRIEPLFGENNDKALLSDVFKIHKFDEIYLLASQSRPSVSWRSVSETLSTNALPIAILLEIIVELQYDTRIYHASSSEMFGDASTYPQDELTPWSPSNPYALSKLTAHQLALMYREHFNVFVSNGILFNHESERRPIDFLAQKVTFGAACASLGIVCSKEVNEAGEPIVNNGKLSLGNLDIEKDWGYAPDYALAMWLILQHHKADDFVVGTGVLHSIKDMCRIAYECVGHDWQEFVITNNLLKRNVEAKKIVANPTKAMTELGWQPTVNFDDMLSKMIDNHLENLKKQAL